MQTQAYGMLQGNNTLYGNASYNDIRASNYYPGSGNQYSFPSQDGRNSIFLE